MRRCARSPRGPGLVGDDGVYLVDPASSHMLVSKIKPCILYLWRCMKGRPEKGYFLVSSFFLFLAPAEKKRESATSPNCREHPRTKKTKQTPPTRQSGLPRSSCASVVLVFTMHAKRTHLCKAARQWWLGGNEGTTRSQALKRCEPWMG